MKLEKINECNERFKYHLRGLHEFKHKYRYEAQTNWQQRWDLTAPDFLTMYGQSLQSKTSARLWGGSKDSAKSVVESIIAHNAQFTKMAFTDLLDESKDMALRIDRFLFHLDDQQQNLQSKDKRINTHYHDKVMACMYLAFEYPTSYCLWDYRSFEKTMILVESRNIPKESETDRYFKSMRALYNVISKDTELISIIQKLYKDSGIIYYPSLLIMNDWIEFVSNAPV